MRRRSVWREVCIPKRAAKRVPPLPQVASPMQVICSLCRIVIRAQGETSSGSRSRRDLALTERITTGEFAHGERKLDRATPTRNITQAPAIMTLDGGGCESTEWTTRCRVRGTHRNQQAAFRHLDLINKHPFRERKQRRPFHDTLALRDETIFKRFLMESTIS